MRPRRKVSNLERQASDNNMGQTAGGVIKVTEKTSDHSENEAVEARLISEELKNEAKPCKFCHVV